MKFLYHDFAVILSFFLIPQLAYASDGSEIRISSFPGSNQKQGTIEHVLSGTFDEVWEALIGADHFSQTMPRNEKTIVLEQRTDFLRYRAHLNMPWPISDVEYDCDMFMNVDRKWIEFKMVPGTGKGVKNFYGHWDLKPQSDHAILAKYSMVFESEKNYPQWAMNIGLKSTLGNVMKKLQSYIDQQHQVKK